MEEDVSGAEEPGIRQGQGQGSRDRLNDDLRAAGIRKVGEGEAVASDDFAGFEIGSGAENMGPA